MSRVRFALVGCGRVCHKHVDALTQNPAAELVAVCDTVLEKAQRVAHPLGIPAYESYSEMLATHKVDVVSILTPSGNHAAHTIDIATKFQTHIVCEKPMALQLSDADRMIAACDEAGVRLFVVKQNRYNLPVQKLKTAIDAQKLGKIVLGTVRVRWCRTQEYYNSDPWRGTWEMDGGVLSNQASHHVDLLEWILGEPVSVMAKTGTYLAKIEADDTAAAIVKFRSGALGIIEATTAARPFDLEGSLSILGSKGSVVIGGFAVNKMEAWNLAEESPEERAAVLAEFSEMPPSVYGFGHKRYYAEIINVLHSKQPALVDGIEGRKSLELINAIYESSETGKEVFMRFEPRRSKLGKSDTQSISGRPLPIDA